MVIMMNMKFIGNVRMAKGIVEASNPTFPHAQRIIERARGNSFGIIGVEATINPQNTEGIIMMHAVSKKVHISSENKEELRAEISGPFSEIVRAIFGKEGSMVQPAGHKGIKCEHCGQIKQVPIFREDAEFNIDIRGIDWRPYFERVSPAVRAIIIAEAEVSLWANMIRGSTFPHVRFTPEGVYVHAKENTRIHTFGTSFVRDGMIVMVKG